MGTGGETLDPVVTTAVTSGSGETNMEDPSGNTNFNGENLVAATGDYWGVMALTLNQNGYRVAFPIGIARSCEQRPMARGSPDWVLHRQGRGRLPHQ